MKGSALLAICCVFAVVGGFFGWATTGSAVYAGIGAVAGILIAAMCGLPHQG